jgi:segregation and condensation protein B
MPNDIPDAQDLSESFQAMLGEVTWEELPAEPAPPAVDTSSPPPPERIVEALLFVGGAPLTEARARQVIRGLSAEQFTAALDELNRAYRRQNRPYHIQPRGEGYVLALRPSFRGVVDKVFGGMREARLSTQAIDVLAAVAYRQPATKAEIDSLRGAESGGLLRQLVRRGLIQVVYRADANVQEVSYGTTPRFLEVFNLQSLDDLPKTQEFV